MPNVAIDVFDADLNQYLVVSAEPTTMVAEQPFPGTADNVIPAGSQNAAILALYDLKANVGDVMSAEAGALFSSDLESLDASVGGLSGQVEGLATTLTETQNALSVLDNAVRDLNTAGVQSAAVDSSQHLIFTLTDGTTRDVGALPLDPQFRGLSTSKPSSAVAGVIGDYYRNNGTASKVFGWRCTAADTTSGVYTWEDIAPPVYDTLYFYFSAADSTVVKFTEARTYASPITGSNQSSGVSYSYHTSTDNGVTWSPATYPLNVAANAMLRVTCNGLTSGNLATVSIPRIG